MLLFLIRDDIICLFQLHYVSVSRIAFSEVVDSFVNLLNRPYLDIGGNVMLTSDSQHLIRFIWTANERSGELGMPAQNLDRAMARNVI